MLGCCLLTAVKVLSANCCYAKPQEQQSSALPSTKERDVPEKPTREAESSSLPTTPTASPADYYNSLGFHLVKNIAVDQRAIWTSPARVRLEDATWLVPLGGLTAGFIATDRDTSLHISQAPKTLNHYKSLSDYGIAGMAGGVGALYFWGKLTGNDHASEAGLLSGEAALDSLGVTTAIKYAAGRERPLQRGKSGAFWNGGDSFPSDHATVAWSVASVLSHEYPGPLSKLLAFGAATAISMARVQARQHFPSDVLVGSAIGWFTGQQVYNAHHDPELGGDTWGSLAESLVGDHPYEPKNMGSPYIALDSWIYPALDRLEAMGYVRGGFLGLRPWTRIECAQLADDAAGRINEDTSAPVEAQRILEALNSEFAPELNLLGGGMNRNVRLESVYSRVTEISGKPLTDGFDFGQTIVNDYGRPYERGTNAITGFSGWASAGPFVGYARVEYQYAPSAPVLPLQARQVIQKVQSLPSAPPGTPVAAVGQPELLEGYVGLQYNNWQITFGKQELWWGPDQSGPMLFSNNAAPIEMFQINRVAPFTLPSILRRAGPVRVQFFLGRLTGQEWVFSVRTGFTGSWTQPLGDQPFVDGGKISIKPTPNLEMGMGVTTILAGPGVPFTLHKLGQAFYSFSDTGPGSPGDPGSRHGGFDFTYRIPKLRNWLTLYADCFTNDEISPWRNWNKAAVISGIYVPRIPKVPKLDFRAEGIYTDPPTMQPSLQHGFFYFNDRFVNGYTNSANLIGSWIGRQGQGADAWSTYWFTPKDNLQLNFRHEKVSKGFIPNGGTITDAGVRASVWLHSALSVAAAVQYETWDFPVISPTKQTNVTTSIALTFWPGSRGTRVGGSESVGGGP
jgi:Capsule assembly protein Wzi/PAP2 superfamily